MINRVTYCLLLVLSSIYPAICVPDGIPNAGFVDIIGREPILDVELWTYSWGQFLPLDSPSVESSNDLGIDSGKVVSSRGKSSNNSSDSSSITEILDSVEQNLTQRVPFLIDSLSGDTIFQAIAPDSVKVELIKISKDGLDADVIYNARDSIQYDISGEWIYLYGESEITYQSFNLKSEYIAFNWKSREMESWGMTDSNGVVIGKPEFTDKQQQFSADTIRYNFDTKKGKIFAMRTSQQDGIIGFSESKMNEYEEIYGYDGYYTTCTADEPHFHIQAKKAKVVPDKLVVTGPANLVIENVQTPLFLPFGIFPLSKEQNSGVIFPEWTDSQEFGFGLLGLGYYLALSDKIDLSLTGDIYTQGSWRSGLAMNYKTRYRYSGRLSLSYANLRFGAPIESTFRVTKDFKISWNHRQDSKARPNSTFSSDVTVGTSTFNTNATTNINDYLNNTFTSNITWTKTFPGKPFTLQTAVRHSQNTQTRNLSLTVPDVTFNVRRIQPFERSIQTGESKWYESIGFTYTAKALNRLNTVDTLLFNGDNILDKFEFGVSHSLPISTSFKVFKNFNLSPNIKYTEYWYPNFISQRYVQTNQLIIPGNFPVGAIIDTTVGFIVTDTLSGFRAARFFSMGASLNTRVYSTATFNGKLKAIRHVMTPSINFTYRPDFGAPNWNYYGDVNKNLEGDVTTYNKFQNGLFGAPPNGQVGSVGLSLSNLIEAKIYDKSDTVKHEKKIRILDALNLSANYNFAADSFRMSNINLNGRTRLLDKIDINFSANFDPYSRDSLGRRQRESEWTENGRPFRFNTGNLSVSSRFNGGQAADGSDKPRWAEWDVWEIDPGYADFNIPWAFSISYNLRVSSLTSSIGRDSLSTTQSINFNGNFNLTPKWKFTVSSGYDFKQKEFTLTNVSIDRDLHCWQMGFNWIPFGPIQSYNFHLGVKSSILQSLKINRRQQWYDDF